MKELDFTGEWLTRDGSNAVIKLTPYPLGRNKFMGVIKNINGKIPCVYWDADGNCLGFSGWDLQKRLDGYPTE